MLVATMPRVGILPPTVSRKWTGVIILTSFLAGDQSQKLVGGFPLTSFSASLKTSGLEPGGALVFRRLPVLPTTTKGSIPNPKHQSTN